MNPAELVRLSRLYDEAVLLPRPQRAAWLERLAASEGELAAALAHMLAVGGAVPTRRPDEPSTEPHAAPGIAPLGGDPSAQLAWPDPERGRGPGATTEGAADPAHGRRSAEVAADSGFLATPAAWPAFGPALRPGERVGPYRLLRPLGAGGMGTVWLAERADGAPRRPVALKLRRMAGDEHLAARMVRETEIVARLDHPHIARLYDSGVDAAGRPYLALAWIDGQPIDAWCRERAATAAQRVGLVLQVGDALSYAHARLVVHRDIKPSNVLVDARGHATLLDFGVAKLLEAAADDGLTREHGRALTPAYAAPELLRGEPVTVGCDVYALGALLFELLVGTPPPRPAPDADPPCASRIAERLLREPDAGDVPAPVRLLRGDLDAVLARALHPQPARRYPTVEAFTADLRAWRDGRPVAARPDRLAYRLGKALRRHRMPVAAGAAVLLALVAGTTAALREAERARLAAERAQVVKAFVVDVFRINARGTPGHAELRRLPAEALLARGAALIDARFAGEPALQAELHGVVAEIFADMGAYEPALQHARAWHARLAERGAATAERAAAQLLIAQAAMGLGRAGEALTAARASLQLAAGAAGPGEALAADARLIVANAHRELGETEAAARALAAAEAALPAGASRAAAQARLLRARLIDPSQFARALPLYEEAIRVALAAEGPLSPTATDARLHLAGQLVLQGRDAEADAHRGAALAALRDGGAAGRIRAALIESEHAVSRFMMGAQDHAGAIAVIERNRDDVATLGPWVPAGLRARLAWHAGSVKALWGDVGAALPLLEDHAPVLVAELENARERMLLAAYRGLAAMYAGQHAKADALLRERAALRAAAGGARHPYAAFDHGFVALNLSLQGRHDEALAVLDEAEGRDAPLAATGVAPVEYAQVLAHARARVLLARGRPAEAEALLPAAYTRHRQLPWDAAQLRAEVECALGRPGAASRLQRALAEQAPFVHPSHPEHLRAQAVAGLCWLAQGRVAAAREIAQVVAAAAASAPAVGEVYLRPLRELQRRLASRG